MSRKRAETINTITVQEVAVSVVARNGNDYISLTDIAKAFGDDTLIYSWMRNRNTIEYLHTWELIHNPSFKGNESVTFKKEAGLNSFNLTPRKWVDATDAIGIYSRAGSGGGTFAHVDIALEFATWLSPPFKLYLIQEVQRLKQIEAQRASTEWQLNRELAKLNFRIQTGAIKEHLIPPEVSAKEARITYANEADLLNKAVFGMTAKQWRAQNKGKPGNVRDYADVSQLLVLSNLESINAVLIEEGHSEAERVQRLNRIARQQLRALQLDARLRTLPGAESTKD